MRWPWRRPAVEHRSSYTDQVVTAILQSATAGGVRPALATAALEACASMYASALAACEVSGPSAVTRALDATWRASVASSLVRHGQALYLIDADPSAGLALAPVSHWDVHGGPDVASWWYRCALSGPSTTAWRTRSAGGCLHLRWLVDPARPWAGVSPLQHAADTGSLAGWLEKRLSEEASGPVGSFCRWRDSTPTPTPTWTPTPTRSRRSDATSARRAGQSWRSSHKWRRRILRPVRHGKILWCSDSARIRHAILWSCANRSHATSGPRAASRAPCSTARHRGKPVGKRGGSL